MGYAIYFDESNKLDQPNDGYSYYGAFGTDEVTMNKVVQQIEQVNAQLRTTSEMHFAEYTSDKDFGKYFKSMNSVVNHDIHINIFIVNNEDAKSIRTNPKLARETGENSEGLWNTTEAPCKKRNTFLSVHL